MTIEELLKHIFECSMRVSVHISLVFPHVSLSRTQPIFTSHGLNTHKYAFDETTRRWYRPFGHKIHGNMTDTNVRYPSMDTFTPSFAICIFLFLRFTGASKACDDGKSWKPVKLVELLKEVPPEKQVEVSNTARCRGYAIYSRPHLYCR